MKDEKKNVNLRITSNMYIENLRPSGDAFRRELELEDKTQILTEGMLYSKNDATYITYEELETDGSEDSRTMFRLKDGAIRIRKYGSSDDERFVAEERFLCHKAQADIIVVVVEILLMTM